jgi:hypothetical protein
MGEGKVGPLAFVGCVSVCPDPGGWAVARCVCDTYDRSACACTNGDIPDGWADLPGGFECQCDPPEGFCGQ